MKKILLCFMAVAAAVVLYSCQQGSTGTCHISGTVPNAQLEGKRIFLVPLYGPKTAETVDSMEITNGKFEFTTDSMKMYKILLDYHYRFNTQTLLVVGEPGEVTVVIDSISSAKGAPQNDSLQMWKELTESHNRTYGGLNQQIRALRQRGDSVEAAHVETMAHTVHVAYKQRTRQLAANMKGTTLGDFLGEMFPLTYKKKMPDGSIQTFDADTNEPVK